ncbi:MAG: protein phosphatase CheZ [Succinatimonas sp.]|nr:protein phosphatase CheZ [Succinatimonas sp.]
MDNKENAASVTEHLSVQEIDEIRDLLEAGMQEEAEAQFLEVAGRLKKDDLYNAVGSLTRDLHESLLKFTEDDRLKTITNVEMPDASERLKTIINMTGEAANTTLDAVDACIPKIRDLVAVLEDLLPAWKELMKGQIDRNTFVALCHKVDTLINKTQKGSDDVSSQLNSIMMAQGYQDLTGQMLQKVIGLVSEVEDKLVSFLVTFGSKDKNNQSRSDQDALAPQGPAVTSLDKEAGVAASQDDVDDLLASLGF